MVHSITKYEAQTDGWMRHELHRLVPTRLLLTEFILKMSVLEFHISCSSRSWTFLEAGMMALELVDTLGLIRMLLLSIIVLVELIVGITRELEETTVVSCLATLLVCLVMLM